MFFLLFFAEDLLDLGCFSDTFCSLERRFLLFAFEVVVLLLALVAAANERIRYKLKLHNFFIRF